jgi:serine/threonine-protein kinase PknG
MAAFGLARVRATRGDIDGAVAAYRLVPQQSSAYRTAQGALAELLARSQRGLPDLAEAMRTLEETSLSPRRRAEVTTHIFRAALATVAKQGAAKTILIGTQPATEPRLRVGLEGSLRDLARHTPDLDERIALVDEANAVRPWSLW